MGARCTVDVKGDYAISLFRAFLCFAPSQPCHHLQKKTKATHTEMYGVGERRCSFPLQEQQPPSRSWLARVSHRTSCLHSALFVLHG